MEHMNLVFKTEAKTYCGKFTEKTLKRVSKSAQATDDIAKNYDRTTKIFRPSGVHALPDWSDDINKLVKSMMSKELYMYVQKHRSARSRKAKNTPHPDVLRKLKMPDLKKWLKSCFENFSRKHFYHY
jgi:hypothetical protein